MHPPKEALPPAEAAVLWAVIRARRPTTRSVAEETGLSISYVHARLQELRRKGLVAWTVGRAGTLHPTCGFVVAPKEEYEPDRRVPPLAGRPDRRG